jgi:hypothetical protein
MSRRYSVACTPGDSFVLSSDGWARFCEMMTSGCPEPARELEEWSHWRVEPMQDGQRRLYRFYPEVKAK